jgi:hypothetical protein
LEDALLSGDYYIELKKKEMEDKAKKEKLE